MLLSSTDITLPDLRIGLRYAEVAEYINNEVTVVVGGAYMLVVLVDLGRSYVRRGVDEN